MRKAQILKCIEDSTPVAVGSYNVKRYIVLGEGTKEHAWRAKKTKGWLVRECDTDMEKIVTSREIECLWSTHEERMRIKDEAAERRRLAEKKRAARAHELGERIARALEPAGLTLTEGTRDWRTDGYTNYRASEACRSRLGVVLTLSEGDLIKLLDYLEIVQEGKR